MAVSKSPAEQLVHPIQKTDLIYQIEDRPPFREAVFVALQHLLAIFVAIITPPLIISQALGFEIGRAHV